MNLESLLSELQAEKADLHLKLQDLEYFIQIKEEELTELRNAAEHTAALSSKLENNLYEIEQMQLRIQEEERKKTGALKRESALEEEIIQSIDTEKSFYEIREQFQSNQAMLQELTDQLNESSHLYKLVADLQKKIAALESELEIVKLDNEFLKEDLNNKEQHQSTSYFEAANNDEISDD